MFKILKMDSYEDEKSASVNKFVGNRTYEYKIDKADTAWVTVS